MENARLEKGKAIAARHQARQAPDGRWMVLSQSRPRAKYIVVPDAKAPSCTCLDFETWEMDCKHIYAVRFTQGIEAGVEIGDVVVYRPAEI